MKTRRIRSGIVWRCYACVMDGLGCSGPRCAGLGRDDVGTKGDNMPTVTSHAAVRMSESQPQQKKKYTRTGILVERAGSALRLAGP